MKRVGYAAVLGYLLAGAAIGPWGLGMIDDINPVRHLSEFGVVLLLMASHTCRDAVLVDATASMVLVYSIDAIVSLLILGWVIASAPVMVSWRR